MVFHGRDSFIDRMRKKLRFSEVVSAIKANAFTNSPYPVIICLENHCSPRQQARIAEILKKTLKDQLVMPLEDVKDHACLPSPDQLREKFLVECKRVHTGEHFHDEQHEEHDHITDKDVHKEKHKVHFSQTLTCRLRYFTTHLS